MNELHTAYNKVSTHQNMRERHNISREIGIICFCHHLLNKISQSNCCLTQYKRIFAQMK